MLSEIFQSKRGASAFLRPPKKFQSGGLVRPRPLLCIGPRRAMVHHASRNFPKHVRGVETLAASKKLQSENLFGIASRFRKACGQQFATTIPGIFGNTHGASTLWRPSKSSKAVARRSRFALCACPRGAMVHHVSRYFLETFVRRLANYRVLN